MVGTETKGVEAGGATMNLGWLPVQTDCQRCLQLLLAEVEIRSAAAREDASH